MSPPLNFTPVESSDVDASDFDIQDVILDNATHSLFCLRMNSSCFDSLFRSILNHLDFSVCKTRTALVVVSPDTAGIWRDRVRSLCASMRIAPRRISVVSRSMLNTPPFPCDLLVDLYRPDEETSTPRSAIASIVRLGDSDYVYRPHFRITINQ